jgi:hypothetical protein
MSFILRGRILKGMSGQILELGDVIKMSFRLQRILSLTRATMLSHRLGVPAPSTAENTKQKIMSRPEVREAFQELLDEYIPMEQLVRCISEGLDTNEILLSRRRCHRNCRSARSSRQTAVCCPGAQVERVGYTAD